MTWPPEGFVEAGPLSRKLACEVCGASGYSGGKWMDSHRRPHLPCPWCRKPLKVKLDGTARVHTRCPKRPDELVVSDRYGPTTEDASGVPEPTPRRTA